MRGEEMSLCEDISNIFVVASGDIDSGTDKFEPEYYADMILSFPAMKELLECQKTLALCAEAMKAGDFSEILQWKESHEKLKKLETIAPEEHF